MDFELGKCYQLIAVNREILEFKFIGTLKGYPEGELFDGTLINLLIIGGFESAELIVCPN